MTGVELIPASLADAELLLTLRNDKDARSMSIHTELIASKDHLAWLAGTLRRDDRALFVVTTDGKRVGMVRADYTDDVVQLSVNMLPDARGKGLARHALMALMAKLAPEAKVYEATVNRQNAPSLNLFGQLGFEEHSNDSEFLILRKDPKKMSDKNKYDLIIDQIEAVRTRNNRNWMDILRLAFRHSPDEAAAILKDIYREDKAVSDLAAKLTGED